MRTDNNLGQDYLTSKDWNDDTPDQHLTYNVFETIEENGQKRVVMNSLSGWERNHLFLNRGDSFDDVSLISGVDSDRDTRAHCSWDIDRDGYSDLAIANGNKPQLQVYRNRMGEISDSQRNFVAVQLVGGNTTNQPSQQWSSRDAVGTLVNVKSGELSYVRELRFGEGFAGQNSKTLILGINRNETADLSIRWLSGKNQEFEKIAAGSLVTIYENPEQSKSGSGADIEDYSRRPEIPSAQTAFEGVLELNGDLTGKEFHLVTSMATWCMSCKKQIPQLELLKQRFGDQVGLIGLPIDPQDSQKQLEDYVNEHEPAYRLSFEATNLVREEFKDFVARNRGKASLPSTILIDSKGNVIESWLGVPSISEVANLTDKPNAQ